MAKRSINAQHVESTAAAAAPRSGPSARALRRSAVVVAALAGLGLSGCTAAPSGSEPPAAPGTAAATTPSGPSGAASPSPSGQSTTEGAASSSPDPDNAPAPSTPAAPLPNPVTTPIVKAVRADQPARPTVPAATDVVPFADPVSYGDGLSLRVTKARGGAEEGQGPGIFPGREYVAFDVELTNSSGTPVDLSQVVVTAHYGDGKQLAPAVYTASAQTLDFAGVVQPGGGKATATYAFAVPKSELGNVTLVVDFDATHASAVYSGEVRLS